MSAALAGWGRTVEALAAALESGELERASALTQRLVEETQALEWTPETVVEARAQASAVLARAESRSAQLLDLIRAAGRGRQGVQTYQALLAGSRG